jgi:hypothetical protein
MAIVSGSTGLKQLFAAFRRFLYFIVFLRSSVPLFLCVRRLILSNRIQRQNILFGGIAPFADTPAPKNSRQKTNFFKRSNDRRTRGITTDTPPPLPQESLCVSASLCLCVKLFPKMPLSCYRRGVRCHQKAHLFRGHDR